MRRVVVAAVVVGVVLAGCRSPTGSADGSLGLDGPSVPAGTSSASGSDDVVMVTCGGLEYEQVALDTAPDGSTLPSEPAGAVDHFGSPSLTDLSSWTVVVNEEDRVELVRELDEPQDFGGGDVRTHEHRTLERRVGDPDLPDGTWMVMMSGPCLPRMVPPAGLGEAHVSLAQVPDPQATTVELLVTERACASGQSAHGRIELVELVELADQVLVRIGIQPPPGDSGGCQGNPPTPYTIELDQPLGDRELMDASAVPPVVLDVWTQPF